MPGHLLEQLEGRDQPAGREVCALSVLLGVAGTDFCAGKCSWSKEKQREMFLVFHV